MATPIPANDAQFSMDVVVAVTGGTSSGLPWEARGVTTDSRAVRKVARPQEERARAYSEAPRRGHLHRCRSQHRRGRQTACRRVSAPD